MGICMRGGNSSAPNCMIYRINRLSVSMLAASFPFFNRIFAHRLLFVFIVSRASSRIKGGFPAQAMRNSASKYLTQKERDGLSPIPASLHQAGVPLPASLLTQRVCSSTISTSDANDPMAIISMLFLFVKQSAFICRTFIEDDQRVRSLPGVPPCAGSATGGAHGGT